MAVEVEAQAHLVHFYEHEDELAEVVGDYLATALSAGDVVVVLATEPHRRAFEAAVATAGLDVEGLRRDGALAFLDAAETLSRFMHDDGPDPTAFDEVVGGLVRHVASTGRRIFAYGEMVALLWDAGQVNAAIELEVLWNELGEQLPFSLLCAYPAPSVGGEAHADALEDVCRLHSAVVGHVEDTGRSEEVRAFAGTPAGPREARRFVAETLERWGRGTLVSDAVVVVTELATNAVIHAGSQFVVTLRLSTAGVRLSVGDRSPVMPTVRSSGSSELSGRGLVLVAALAARWGAEPADNGGKAVWAELHEVTAAT